MPIMGRSRTGPTRRTALAGLGVLPASIAAANAGTQPPQPDYLPDNVPMNGKAGPGLKAFDEAMLKIMDRHGIPGASLAIAKEGKLVLAKGYGWANIASGKAIQPDTLFGLASLSKPLTAIAVLKLVEQGKLELDAPVFGLLKHIKLPARAQSDPRLPNVTVRHCLHHS